MAFLHFNISTAGLYHTLCEGRGCVLGGAVPSKPVPAPPWRNGLSGQEIPAMFINQLIRPQAEGKGQKQHSKSHTRFQKLNHAKEALPSFPKNFISFSLTFLKPLPHHRIPAPPHNNIKCEFPLYKRPRSHLRDSSLKTVEKPSWGCGGCTRMSPGCKSLTLHKNPGNTVQGEKVVVHYSYNINPGQNVIGVPI